MFGGEGSLIVHGSPYGSGVREVDQDYRLRVTGTSTLFGRAGAPVGDVTGDGLADVALPDYTEANDVGGNGVIYILDSSHQGELTAAGIRADGVTNLPFSQLGIWTSAGDVAGSGTQLLVTSMEGFDGSTLSHTTLWGLPLPLTSTSASGAEALLHTPTNSGQMIMYVMSVEDLNLDGQNDLYALMVNPETEELTYGLYYGPVVDRDSVDVDVELTGDFQGLAIQCVGDLDGDGDPDTVLRAPGDGTRTDDGKIYLLDIQQSGDVEDLSFAEIIGGADDDEPNSAVVEDVDGDGTADLFVGFDRSETDYRYQGWAGVFYGPFTGNRQTADRDAVVFGDHENSFAGYYTGDADLNGNGVLDLLVGFREATEAESHLDVFFDGL
ncbi:MAG TPA: hypothetical protein PLA94_01775 [Myxococcota bacterium]|nr:hypothetical protein [Myxococcota bacterium]